MTSFLRDGITEFASYLRDTFTREFLRPPVRMVRPDDYRQEPIIIHKYEASKWNCHVCGQKENAKGFDECLNPACAHRHCFLCTPHSSVKGMIEKAKGKVKGTASKT